MSLVRFTRLGSIAWIFVSHADSHPPEAFVAYGRDAALKVFADHNATPSDDDQPELARLAKAAQDETLSFAYPVPVELVEIIHPLIVSAEKLCVDGGKRKNPTSLLQSRELLKGRMLYHWTPASDEGRPPCCLVVFRDGMNKMRAIVLRSREPSVAFYQEQRPWLINEPTLDRLRRTVRLLPSDTTIAPYELGPIIAGHLLLGTLCCEPVILAAGSAAA